MRTLALAFVFAAATACSDVGTGTGTPVGNDDLGLQTDQGTADVPLDQTTEPDVTPDPDGGPDATPDAVEDATPDAVEDALDDTLPDPGAPDVTPDEGPAEPDIPEPDVTPLFGNCSEPGGGVNIYDLQDPQCPDHFDPEPVGTPGVYVELTGVIVTAAFGDTVFVQEPAGGPYSGIAIFTHGIFTGDLSPGDILDVQGNYSEFFENSQIYLEDWTVTGSTDAPEPYVPAHPQHISTEGELGELFEGVLVRVENVETIHTQPDCPHDYGEWTVSGGLRIDDMGVKWAARLGDQFESVTGPLNYSFGNFKIEPRFESDIAWTVKGSEGAISKCIAAECSVDASVPGSKAIVVNEMMPDPAGTDSGQEWIELYNPGDAPVDIAGWEIRDCGDQAWPITGADTVIGPGEYFVVGMNANPNSNGEVPVDVAYGQAFYMPNTVGSVLIYDGSGPTAKLVDQTRYSRFDPWDQMQAGHSLERITPLSDGTLPESWATGQGTWGPSENEGTPGGPNSAN